MHKFILILIIATSCSQNTTTSPSNQDLVMSKYWKTYDYKRNGNADAVVIAQQPTFQFRSDSKVYFSQINPAFRDTFSFQFINDDNIKLTKPQVSTSYYINLKIERLTENDFDFTTTDNQTTNVYAYKTTKQ